VIQGNVVGSGDVSPIVSDRPPLRLSGSQRDWVKSSPQPATSLPEWILRGRHRSTWQQQGNAAVRLTVAQVDEIRRQLAAQPPAPTVRGDSVSKLAAVTAAAPELLGLRRNGWGIAALAAFLTERGLPISAGTLKNYLQRAGATRTKRRRRQTTSPPGAALPTASASAQPAEQRSSVGRASPAVTHPTQPVRPIPPGSFVVREDSEI
jgi:hypothetical protein